MKKLLFVLSALSLLATVIPADAGSCPPGKRWYCSGSKCGCVWEKTWRRSPQSAAFFICLPGRRPSVRAMGAIS